MYELYKFSIQVIGNNYYGNIFGKTSDSPYGFNGVYELEYKETSTTTPYFNQTYRQLKLNSKMAH